MGPECCLELNATIYKVVKITCVVEVEEIKKMERFQVSGRFSYRREIRLRYYSQRINFSHWTEARTDLSKVYRVFLTAV